MLIGSGLLNKAGELIKESLPGRRLAVLSGKIVSGLYAGRLQEELEASGFSCRLLGYPGGEAYKNMETLADILNEMAELELSGDSALIALGGGVTGDMGGLSAALYRRGIPYIQMPTTLLAMVDSSVGGKTAVNLNSGKNLAGVFKQPDMVICDVACLDTLPERYFNEGMAEVIKYSVLTGEDIHLIENREEMISRCIKIKASYVEADEFDTGERRKLNFGHTIGHAVERLSGFSLLHGEAVAIGMSIITRGCCALGFCESTCRGRLHAALEMFSLPEKCEFEADEILQQTRLDKKRGGDSITLILPLAYGQCEAVKTDYAFLRKIIEAGIAET